MAGKGAESDSLGWKLGMSSEATEPSELTRTRGADLEASSDEGRGEEPLKEPSWNGSLALAGVGRGESPRSGALELTVLNAGLSGIPRWRGVWSASCSIESSPTLDALLSDMLKMGERDGGEKRVGVKDVRGSHGESAEFLVDVER